MPILRFSQTVDGVPRTWDLEVGDREATLGRDRGCTIALEDKAISRSHARILPSPQGILLRDLGSSNGTWVNGQRITEALLRDGDEIRLGACVIRFVLPLDQAKTVMMEAEALKSHLTPPVPQSPPQPAAAPPPPIPPSPPALVPPPPPPEARPLAPSLPPPPPASNHPTPPLPPVVRVTDGPPAPRPVPKPAAAPRKYAGFWIRFLAYILDLLILGFVSGTLMIPGTLMLRSFSNEQGKFIAASMGIAGLLMILGLLYVLFFWALGGGTPGKKMLGLRIVREDGVEPMGWGTACLRLLGYMVDGFTFTIGFIIIAFSARKRGLHDMIAGTTVIRSR